ncbi:MAG: hypothetical protein FWG84_06590 [Bacteroidales bacterium]|nr:hypothetical protein [Bacteroidales bacterium]
MSILLLSTTKGLAERLAEGREEGRAEGEAERAKLKAEKESAEAKLKAEKEQTVLNSHRAGIPIATIADITNLTVEQVIEILRRVES